MLGIHVWEKRKFDKYDSIMHAVCLLSVISWKKFHGKIHLYTNEAYLQDLEEWGIDKYYDKIDTTKLKEIPEDIEIKDFWAWGKLHIAKDLKPPYVILDNDLWLNEPLKLPIENAFTGYHYESFDPSIESGQYPDFDFMLPKKYLGLWKKWILPVNMALCFVNSKHLQSEWLKVAEDIAKHKSEEKFGSSAKMCFVEQRLLPMIAYEMGFKYGTFVEPIYNTHFSHLQNGMEWTPNYKQWDEFTIHEFSKIKHVWGLKHNMENENIRKAIIFQIIQTFEKYPNEMENHKNLLDEIKSFL